MADRHPGIGNHRLNQYSSRIVPGYVQSFGTANANSRVALWTANGSYTANPTSDKWELGSRPTFTREYPLYQNDNLREGSAPFRL